MYLRALRSQSISSGQRAGRTHVKTIMPHGEAWFRKACRLGIGSECCAFQGILLLAESLDAAAKMELCGNSFNAYVVIALLIAIFSIVPLPTQ